MKPTKIFQISGADWMKGLSIQSGLALGGLFRTASNFDPFETMGYMQPSLAPVIVDATTITTQIKHLASFTNGADGFVVGIGDRAATAGKNLYIIKMSDSTVIEYGDKIDQNATTGAMVHRGITVWKNRIIYTGDGGIRSNLLVPTVAADVNLLFDSLDGSSLYPTIFREGSDGVLYYTATGNASIGKIVTTTGTTSNVANAFQFTDTSLIPKDICNDGIYTIFIADNNENKVTTATTRCRIFFWDTIKANGDIIYDIPDSYLISARYVDGKVIVLGASGIWICNSVTPPKLVFPLTTSQLPVFADAVTTKDNILYWAGQGIGQPVYAYGAKLGKPILYTPYHTTEGSDLNIALVSSGTYFIATTDLPKTYILNSGTNRANATIQTVTTPLVQPYTFSYIKVALKLPLATGQEISINLFNGNGATISDTDTKTFTGVGAKQTLIFTLKVSANNFKQFEDLYVQVNPARSTGNGAVPIVQRITVYGIPIPDDGQII